MIFVRARCKLGCAPGDVGPGWTLIFCMKNCEFIHGKERGRALAGYQPFFMSDGGRWIPFSGAIRESISGTKMRWKFQICGLGVHFVPKSRRAPETAGKAELVDGR